MTLAEQITALEAKVIISETALENLRDLYNMIGAEAWYDPANDSTEKFANRLWPKIKALNEELKFRS